MEMGTFLKCSRENWQPMDVRETGIFWCPRRGRSVQTDREIRWHNPLILFTGCEPIKSTSSNWGLPIQGRRISLADLIRFPSESLKYDKSLHRRFNSSTPCDAHGSRSQLLFDYEAFQVDRHGSLAFTRTLGDQAIYDFCVDQVAVRPGPKGNRAAGEQGHLFMAAVFCQPSNVTEVDETLQLLNLPNNSPLLRGNGLHFMLILLANVRAML